MAANAIAAISDIHLSRYKPLSLPKAEARPNLHTEPMVSHIFPQNLFPGPPNKWSSVMHFPSGNFTVCLAQLFMKKILDPFNIGDLPHNVYISAGNLRITKLVGSPILFSHHLPMSSPLGPHLWL